MRKWKVNPSVSAILKYYDKVFKIDINNRVFADIKKADINVSELDEKLIEILNSNTDVAIVGKVTKMKRDFVLELSKYPYKVLSHQALKIYGFIKHDKLEFNTDRFSVSYEEVAKELEHETTKSAYKVIQELIANNIIFKSNIDNVYFINLVLVFKGSLSKIILNILKRLGIINNEDLTELTISYLKSLEQDLIKIETNATERATT